MIIWLLAAQHQLLARPTCGENVRLRMRSWHASRRGAAVVAARTVIPMSTHLVQGSMRASFFENARVCKGEVALLTAEHRGVALHGPDATNCFSGLRGARKNRQGH